MKTQTLILGAFFLLISWQCKSEASYSKKEQSKDEVLKDNNVIMPSDKLSTYDFDKLSKAKQEVQKGNNSYVQAYNSLIKSADEALNEGVFSVVNKTQIPVSGDKHDYLSLGPYWWPDPEKSDGLPWIRRDGEINPMTRGKNVDQPEKSKMFNNTYKLALASYFSGRDTYAEKAIELLKVWFLNPETKMNPNLNYAQGIPGKNVGRGIGIIEFTGIQNIILAIELLKIGNYMDLDTNLGLKKWLSDYLNWLQTSENGLFEKDTKNNHGTWYDVQVSSILLFLDRKQEAKEVLERVKIARIDSQIEPDGRQPHELARTKSLSYSTMNLSGMTTLAYLGKKAGVDLWNYTDANGTGIQIAYKFLEPYALGEKQWDYQQISDIDKGLDKLRALFRRAGNIFGEKGPINPEIYKDLTTESLDILLYGE